MAENGWFWMSILLTSIILTCTNAKTENRCMNNLITPGYTEPHGDIYIEYGQPLDIICVLNEKYMLEHGENSSQDLYFVRNSETLPREMIEILNSSSIRLHIDNSPKSSSMYTCKIHSTAVCLNLVVVDAKPLPVTDFECISYNYENLTCKWTQMENFVKTTYNLTYNFPGRASRFLRYSCPKLITHSDGKTMSCSWNVLSNPQYRQAQRTFYFELNITNIFGYTVVNKTFSHFQHVLSGPPQNLTHVNVTSDSIYLYWTVPVPMQVFPPGVEHRILYQSEYGERNWQQAGILQTPSTDQMRAVYFNLTNLKYAHALYDIRISMRSLAATIVNDESMWSKNSSITVRTMSKAPGAPPSTNIGSFEIVSSSSNSLNNTDMYIYWQQIGDEIKNGEQFEYYIEVEGQPNIRPVEITNAYAKFRNLTVANNYTFNIWSRNSVGRSEKKSTVFVPTASERVGEPVSFTKIAFGSGKYELSWEQPRSGYRSLKNYTIFWCTHDRDRPYQCSGYLRWEEISNDKTMFNITVSEDKINQFAISANSGTSSSGMVWATCTVIHNKAIGKMEHVWINHVYSTSIEVAWKLDCSDRIGSIEGFIIYYCSIVKPTIASCKEAEQNLTIYGDSRTNRANITGLTPYETYMLAVSVMTKHNTQSQKSAYQFATTLEEAPSSPLNVKIANVTNSSVSLVWEKPISTNGRLKNYRIIYYTNGSSPENVIANYEEYTLTNLTSYVNYNISVEACTVECSKPSPAVIVKTKGGYPSEIDQVGVTFQNDSITVVQWVRPKYPRGNINIYEVNFKKKLQYDNDTVVTNTTDTHFTFDNCGEDGKYNTFYISIRAVNIFDDVRYEGSWSQELESYCRTSPSLWLWMLIPGGFIIILGLFYMAKKMYLHCQEMRDVEIKLPSGLAPVVTTDIGLSNWGGPKIQEEQSHHPSADEELLLVKFPNSGNLSGDSSGCSSGHESVTSSLESGTQISSTSDSGTEQPRSSSTEDLHKNSLRLRNVSSSRPSKGYVTVPPDNNASARSPKTAAPGNYCVLGVDPTPVTSINPNYVPASVSSSESTKLPYILPNASIQSSPYVVTGDLNKPSNSGYVPLNSEANEKNPAYVMAGNKGMIVPDLMRLDSMKPTDLEDKSVYVQVADPATNVRKVTPDNFTRHQPTVDTAPLKTGYVTIGDAPGSRACVDPAKGGYIPHRHFDATKTIKED
ncbi:hypothetical protein ILUMI_24978 [Ignelater luminosus]|uniref:Cytokine receptor n=1 Tax=Ignelater luminosus TaxID=2038154 RepID=A0A8K0C853_IGNLU|nr:hypothetical protein ILUMI_24978 [Ignelater luminosus]